MQAYVIRRASFLIPVLLAVSIAVFFALRFMPGDITVILLGPDASPQQVAELRADLGLDQPIPVQYVKWMGNVLQGDLGRSYVLGNKVGAEIMDRAPITLEILALTLFFTAVLGITLGVVSALFRDSPVDYLVRVTSVFGLSVPGWWVGIMILLLPAIWWNYSPPLGYVPLQDNLWENLRQFLPPALTLAAASSAVLMRLTRTVLLDVLRQDYIRTARAKGLRQNVIIVRHAMKNAMIPVITVLGGQMVVLFGGAVIIEQVFSLEGLGRYMFTSIAQRDFPVVQVLALYTAVVVVVLNLLVDISYAWFDPRVRYQ
jgi:peptide/nickel transport system permease protein